MFVEVERNPKDPTGKLEELLGHHRRQSLDVGNTITSVDHDADLLTGGVALEAGDVVLDGALDVVSGDGQLCHCFSSFCSVSLTALNVVWRVLRCQSGRWVSAAASRESQRAVDDLVAH